jgi:hypothetical protein
VYALTAALFAVIVGTVGLSPAIAATAACESLMTLKIDTTAIDGPRDVGHQRVIERPATPWIASP